MLENVYHFCNQSNTGTNVDCKIILESYEMFFFVEVKKNEQQDTFFCAKCDVQFTNLEDYFHHKITVDECKFVSYLSFFPLQTIFEKIKLFYGCN